MFFSFSTSFPASGRERERAAEKVFISFIYSAGQKHIRENGVVLNANYALSQIKSEFRK